MIGNVEQPGTGGRAPEAVPVGQLREGQSGIVRRVEGGRRMAHRLAELGIREGTTLRVLRGRGPMIVGLRDQRLIFGRAMVQRIWVDPEP